MAATVLSALTEPHIDRGVSRVTVTIPTTVDGASGATCDFTFPARPFAIGLQTQSTNYNGKTVALQGSNDGTNFAALPTAVSRTTNGLASVAAIDVAYLFYRVTCTGAPTAAITVTLIASIHV